ncbi:hypothetical protein FACS1894129_1380 [Actinomycetota bacterium]|nr:hypothetical protein FACS1894129_1380 [Actinomycetota bacterium]
MAFQGCLHGLVQHIKRDARGAHRIVNKEAHEMHIGEATAAERQQLLKVLGIG